MFCSSCGVAVAQGLSFCNYCGAKLNRSDNDAPAIRPEALIFGMLATFVFGTVAITVLMGVLKNAMGVPIDRVLGLAVVPALIMLLLEFVFIRLLWRGAHGTREKTQQTSTKGQATNELDAAHVRSLPEHKTSVTEHTTRTFDPIYTERKDG